MDRGKLALALESEIAIRAKVNQIRKPLGTRKELAAIAGVSDTSIVKIKIKPRNPPHLSICGLLLRWNCWNNLQGMLLPP